MGIINCMSIEGMIVQTQGCMRNAAPKMKASAERLNQETKGQYGACLPKQASLSLLPPLSSSPPFSISTSTPIPITIQIYIDRILKPAAILLLLLHRQRIPRHHLKSLLHIRVILGADFRIRYPAPTLTVGHGPLGADGPFVVSDVDLVAEDDEGEGFGVSGGGLDEELVAPRVERLEGFGRIDVVDEDAAVGAAVEGHAKGLEAFLSGGVPELKA
jgi:hypothetical protein